MYVFIFSGFVAPKDLCRYEEGKELYGKPRGNRGFNEGLAEIENQTVSRKPQVKVGVNQINFAFLIRYVVTISFLQHNFSM